MAKSKKFWKWQEEQKEKKNPKHKKRPLIKIHKRWAMKFECSVCHKTWENARPGNILMRLMCYDCFKKLLENTEEKKEDKEKKPPPAHERRETWWGCVMKLLRKNGNIVEIKHFMHFEDHLRILRWLNDHFPNFKLEVENGKKEKPSFVSIKSLNIKDMEKVIFLNIGQPRTPSK